MKTTIFTYLISKPFFYILFILGLANFSWGQCSDPIATYQFDNSAGNDACCWFINIDNQNVSNQITAIEIHNLVDCDLGATTANGGWTISNQSSSGAIITPNTPFIQPGTYTQQFRLCLTNRTAIPHFFDLSFLETDPNGNFQTYCTSTYAIDCPVSDCSQPCPGGVVDLVSNGDFSQGDTGFNSSLSSSCTCSSGSYCITTNANLKCNNSFWNPVMGAGGSGNYMVVDGAVGSIWSQSVNVTLGTNYSFSFDFYPDISGDPSPSLDLLIDGNIVLSNIIGTTGMWSNFCVDWTANTTNTVLLEIQQSNSAGFDDYGIDNVSFTTCCDLNVSLPANLTVCDNDFVQLNPTISGGIAPITYSWSPVTGLSNPNIPNPTAMPLVTTTYTLTATDSLGCTATAMVTIEPIPCPCPNLVINGDFELGDSGFSSGLTSDCTCSNNSYCVTNDSRNKCSNALWNMVLAKSGSGNYMVIDGSIGTIWSQNINVNLGETYYFRFDYYPNVSGGGTPQLQIDLYSGSTQLTSFGTTTGTSGVWTNYLSSSSWTSTLTGTVELRISQNDSPQYSDYGIDNIVFSCNDSIVGITDPSFSTSVLVYPNPVNQLLTIELGRSLDSEIQYELIDMWGRQLQVGQIHRYTSQQQINTSQLPEGIYLLIIGNEKEGYHREKVIKRQF